MPSILTLDAIGPRGEELAMKAGEAIDVPVGYDTEFNCATFDSDAHEGEQQLQTAVFDALSGIDPDWKSHLQVAE